MKHRLFLFFAFLLVVYGVSFLLVKEDDLDLLALIPPNSDIVVEWDSPASSYQVLLESPLGKKIWAMDWPLILRALGLNQEDREEVKRIATNWNRFAESPVFRELFNTRSIVALLASKEQEDASFSSLRKEMVFLNTSGRKTALLHSFFGRLSGMQRLADSTYQGYSIHCYQLKNGQYVYFSTNNELLVAAFDPGPIRQCLDLLLGRIIQKGGGLADRADYMELKQRAEGRDKFFLYVDVASLKPRLETITESKAGTSPDSLLTAQKVERGVQQAVWFHQPLQGMHTFTSIVRFDATDLPVFQKRIYLRPPDVDPKIGDMPADLLTYFWSNWLDLPTWWQEKLKDASDLDLKRADNLANLVHRYTAMHIEDFLGLFGQQIGLHIKEIKTSGFFPVPRVYFCVEMLNRSHIQILLEKFIADLPVRRDMVAGVDVISIQAAGGLMQPSFALLDDHLIFADGRDQINAVLKPSGSMLIHDPDFMKVDMGLQQKNNLVFFARTIQLIDGLKELASWLGTIIAIRDERAGAQSKILIDQAVEPLLDGLMMFKAMAVRSYTAEDELVLQSAVLSADN